MTDVYTDGAANTLANLAAARIPLDEGCPRCGFTLWNPVIALRVSSVGLYDDGRFPGRCLIRLDTHYDELLDVPEQIMTAFLADLRDVRNVLRDVTGTEHLNYAVLGNAERHVHWHVVPRQPDHEPLPARSPWQDPRPQAPLPPSLKTSLIANMRTELSLITAHGPSSFRR